MSACAFIFPGQGSQTVGMGRDLAEAFPAAREVFQEMDDVLGQKLSTLMFEGSQEELTLTENAQPALLAMSLAVLRVIEREADKKLAATAKVVAGHSLGEYSALAAAGSLSLADAARLLRRRGQAMQKAVAPGEGAMAALLGVELQRVREICAEAGSGPEGEEIVEPANDNGGGQVVISGTRAAVSRAVELAKAWGVKRALLLPVSAPFHCRLMAPAARAMAAALGETPPKAPSVPVVANVSAALEVVPGRIRDLLVQQVTATVRWAESVQAMTDHGIDTFVELGAGKVLTGLVKRITPNAHASFAGTPAEIEAVVKTL